MKQIKTSFLLLMAACCLSLVSCSKDEDENENGNPKDENVIVSEDGTVSGNHVFSAIDNKNFFIDYIKYTVEGDHLEVSGYDEVGLSGSAKIISTLNYKGNLYNVSVIQDYAFSECEKLTALTIPNSVTRIEDSAFSCTSLKSVIIPSSVTYLGESVFWGCDELTTVSLPDNLKIIPEYMFGDCLSLASITIPKSVTSIGSHAFYHCESLVSVEIPASVTFIGDIYSDGEEYTDAFSFCTSLTAINVDKDNKNYSSIDGVLFDKDATILKICPEGKKNCNVPSSVTKIAEVAFMYCTSLTSINVAKDNKNYSSIDGVLFDKNATILIICPDGKKGNYNVPSSVTKIAEGAFSNSGIQSITIPNGVQEIESYAFYGCASLTSVIIPNSMTKIEEGAFGGTPSITDIFMLCTTPPSEVSSIVFFNKIKNLHVRRGCKEIYRNWDNYDVFENIIEDAE